MEFALEEVKKSIEGKGGNFLLKTNPVVLGENEKSMLFIIELEMY